MNLTKDSSLNPLASLLFQLADDDFLYAYRGSEWLGLAPHIEEDVASSSISQDSMGHAAMFYKLLSEMGYGSPDLLAHGRKVEDRMNSVLVERVNGPGEYTENPQYDWAYAVARNYIYTTAKKVKMEALKMSGYPPLSDIAVKVGMELYYHEMHWRTWFVQLFSSTMDAKTRMQEALDKVLADFGDYFSLGPFSEEITNNILFTDESALWERWLASVQPIFSSLGIDLPTKQEQPPLQNGRYGDHTPDLDQAILIMSEVYSTEPQGQW
ncbi:MAG: 1,2-phenylacetyl-CoA epoxidase subunit PaaC [Bacillus sp. (in: firmicutes)]